jgi:lipoprotein-releasing system ATP-binding protein
MNLLSCKNVSKYFLIRDQVLAPLKNIHFFIPEGRKTVITGKSGAGKSVLLMLLSGLDHPNFGDIFFQGQALSGMSAGELNRMRAVSIGIIFQKHNLIPSWTVQENILAALISHHNPASWGKERIHGLLNEMGLIERLNHLPHQLSMGERQRVAIARVLVRQPRLILADEPTGDVDPDTAEGINRLLIETAERSHAALLVATHGIFSADGIDTMYELNDGRLTAC